METAKSVTGVTPPTNVWCWYVTKLVYGNHAVLALYATGLTFVILALKTRTHGCIQNVGHVRNVTTAIALVMLWFWITWPRPTGELSKMWNSFSKILTKMTPHFASVQVLPVLIILYYSCYSPFSGIHKEFLQNNWSVCKLVISKNGNLFLVKFCHKKLLIFRWSKCSGRVFLSSHWVRSYKSQSLGSTHFENVHVCYDFVGQKGVIKLFINRVKIGFFEYNWKKIKRFLSVMLIAYKLYYNCYRNLPSCTFTVKTEQIICLINIPHCMNFEIENACLPFFRISTFVFALILKSNIQKRGRLCSTLLYKIKMLQK